MISYQYEQLLIWALTVETWTENLAKILKVLGDPNRLGIVMSIGKGSHSVTEIIDSAGLSQTLVSFHLKVLRNSGIVKTKRDGPFIYYSLYEPAFLDILTELSKKFNMDR